MKPNPALDTLEDSTLHGGLSLFDGAMVSPKRFQGRWSQYGNGQTLTGPHRLPALVNGNVGAVTIDFDNDSQGTLTLPGGGKVAITRFGF